MSASKLLLTAFALAGIGLVGLWLRPSATTAPVPRDESVAQAKAQPPGSYQGGDNPFLPRKVAPGLPMTPARRPETKDFAAASAAPSPLHREAPVYEDPLKRRARRLGLPEDTPRQDIVKAMRAQQPKRSREERRAQKSEQQAFRKWMQEQGFQGREARVMQMQCQARLRDGGNYRDCQAIVPNLPPTQEDAAPHWKEVQAQRQQQRQR